MFYSGSMDEHILLFICYIVFLLATLSNIQAITIPDISVEQNEKVALRWELEKMSQDLLIGGGKHTDDIIYHSYIFGSGVGNREELRVDLIREHREFAAGEGVISWHSVRSAGLVYLLGRKSNSVSLVVTSTQLLSDRSAHFYESSLDLNGNVVCTSLFTRVNRITVNQEVFAVVAVDSSSDDILWFRVADNKLEKLTSWARYRRTSSLAVITVGEKHQLVVVDSGTPAIVDVFDVVFSSDESNLDFRLIRSFPLDSDCSSLTVSSVGRHIYLVFTLPSKEAISVYHLLTSANTSHFEYHTSFDVPQVSEVVSFELAHQKYLAVNGAEAYVFRLTESGDFFVELSPGHVTEWLAVPVFSYRSDVVLFSKGANYTSMFVWAGTNKGFKSVSIPESGSCLEGKWSGAVTVPFLHQYSLLLPSTMGHSRLITVVASLQNKINPVVKELKEMVDSINFYEKVWQNVQIKIPELEETLKHVVTTKSENIITAKWRIEKLETPDLHLNTMVIPRAEENRTSEPIDSQTVDVATLKHLVDKTITAAKGLFEHVQLREEEAWGMDNFTGKINFKGGLVVDSLTISSLNKQSVDSILQNTFRKHNPQPIQGDTVVRSIKGESIVFDKINNSTDQHVKFNDKPITIKGHLIFQKPLHVDGDVHLAPGGKVNGVDLSDTLCKGKDSCSVSLLQDNIEIRMGDTDNNVNNDPSPEPSYTWRKVVAGKNLTVLNVNGVVWETLVKSVVYRDRYQQVPGIVAIKGKLFSIPAMLAGRIEDNHSPQRRVIESANRKVEDRSARVIKSEAISDVVLSELEVTGTVSCDHSLWGADAADVILSDADTIHMSSSKTLKDTVKVTNNLQMEGLDIKKLLTKHTHQVLYGPVTLNGNITFGSVTLTGLLNGVNISVNTTTSIGDSQVGQVTAGSMRVLESLNNISVAELFTDNCTISLQHLSVQNLNVFGDISISGNVCGQDIMKFKKSRFSMKEDQNVTGNFVIDKANITNDFKVEILNGIEISLFNNYLKKNINGDSIHLSELTVEGDIKTERGVNGYNLSHIVKNAVMLLSNNHIKGHIIFKDEVSFNLLECQGFFNQESRPCENWLNYANVVYASNKTLLLSGDKTFLNLLNIYEDLQVEEINNYKVEEILTRTTEQVIKGDLFVSGNISVAEESSLLGLFNGRNLTELTSRCTLKGDTISCTGGVFFNDGVDMDYLNSHGNINGISFDHFADSLVSPHDPQIISGFKRFTGKKTTVKNLVIKIVNNQTWDQFLIDAVYQNMHEEVKHPVVFKESVFAEEVTVSFNIDADTVSGVNLSMWSRYAVYLNDSFALKRAIHLRSASSMGNLTVIRYGDVNMNLDLVHLDIPTHLNSLTFESVTVINTVDIANTVNSHSLRLLEENTLKITGDQKLTSDFVMMGGFLVSGHITTENQVNHDNLQNVVTLRTDQALNGNYKFDCVEAKQNVSVSGLMSSVNMTEWSETAVLSTSDQDITGEWSVTGTVQLRSPVKGKGSLAGLDLAELKENITQDILNVHHQMKGNLSSACAKTNRWLSEARDQSSELLYLDVSQELHMPSGLSLVKYFQSNSSHYLAICERECITTIYKWSKRNGTFSKVNSEMLGYAVKQLIVLSKNQLTYMLTKSSELPPDCHYSGNNLWLFTDNQLKHIYQVDIRGNVLEGYNNTLYSMNDTGVFKWELDIVNGTVFLINTWMINTAGKSVVPQALGLELALQRPTEISTLDSDVHFVSKLYSNCTGEINSLSVHPTRQFIAVASSEKTEVSRYFDHVKVYREDGQLYDILPAQQPSDVQWFPVLDQIWLVFLQNHSLIHLYHMQGALQGFQLMLSANVEATGLAALSLPWKSKVNLQPYLILQTKSSVKILQANLQGDPYLGVDMTCTFDDALRTDPDTV